MYRLNQRLLSGEQDTLSELSKSCEVHQRAINSIGTTLETFIKSLVLISVPFNKGNTMHLQAQVRITGTEIVGTLIHKGFSIGNFMYTVKTSDNQLYRVYKVQPV